MKTEARTYYDTLIHALPDCAPNPTIRCQQRLFNGIYLGQPQWTNMLLAGCLPSHRDTFYVENMSCVITITMGDKYYIEDLKDLLMEHLFFKLMHHDRIVFESPARNILWQRTENEDGSLGTGLPAPWRTPHPMPERTEFHVVADLAGPLTDKTRQMLNRSNNVPYRAIHIQVHGFHQEEESTVLNGDDGIGLGYASGELRQSVFGMDSTTHGIPGGHRPGGLCEGGYERPSKTACSGCDYIRYCSDSRRWPG